MQLEVSGRLKYYLGRNVLNKYRNVFLGVVLGFSILLPFNASGKSSYKVIDKDKSTIQFDFDRTSVIGIEYKLKDWNDAYSIRYFSVENNNRNRIGEKYWVGMWHNDLAPGRHYSSIMDLRSTLTTWSAFKNRQNLIIDQGNVNSSMAEFDYLIFKSNDISCSVFSATFGTDSYHMGNYVGTTRLSGVLCLKKHDTLNEKMIEDLVKSIQVKGHNGETAHRFSFPKNAKSAIRSSGTNSNVLKKIEVDTDDQKQKLEKAKELFEIDLISKGEYEELRKNILGLN
jgi:hypothetical protein